MSESSHLFIARTSSNRVIDHFKHSLQFLFLINYTEGGTDLLLLSDVWGPDGMHLLK